MPELAEVEVVRRNLVTWWEHQTADDLVVFDERILRNINADDFRDIMMQPMRRIERRGKFLLTYMADETVIAFHFRMTGKIVRTDNLVDVKYARLCWHIPQVGWLVFKDQRRFGHIQIYNPGELEDEPSITKIGPEPYDLDLPTLKARLSPNRTLKAALLDQRVVAGVGNIAVSELFWRLRIPPHAKIKELCDDQLQALVNEMPRYFDEIIRASMAEEIIYLEEGGNDDAFDVYGREGQPCKRCQTPIERTIISSRSSFYCPQCQTANC